MGSENKIRSLAYSSVSIHRRVVAIKKMSQSRSISSCLLDYHTIHVPFVRNFTIEEKLTLLRLKLVHCDKCVDSLREII